MNLSSRVWRNDLDRAQASSRANARLRAPGFTLAMSRTYAVPARARDSPQEEIASLRLILRSDDDPGRCLVTSGDAVRAAGREPAQAVRCR
jgi:hypothetical protein